MLKLLRKNDVLDLTGFSHARLYRRIQAGTFPKPVKDGPKCSRWPSTEVETLVAAIIAGQSEDQQRELVMELKRKREEAFTKTMAEIDQAAA